MDEAHDSLEEAAASKAEAARILMELLMNELPERYKVIGKLKSGGMGAIYQATNRSTRELVAVKVLRSDKADSEEVRRRFIRETSMALALSHPNICRVQDSGITSSGIMYLIMDWIDGISVAQRVEYYGSVPVPKALPIFLQITAALAHAHGKRLIYRDLKPENVMLVNNTRAGADVRLVDFGLTKALYADSRLKQSKELTQSGIVVGTPLYMSPEQAKGVPEDQRSDIYSFGCLMYFILAGRPPFESRTAVETMRKHLEERPAEFAPALKIPTDMRDIVFRCLEKQPGDRYTSMEELDVDLKKLTKTVGLGRRGLITDKKRMRRRLVTIACLIAGFAVMYVISTLKQSTPGVKTHSVKPSSAAHSVAGKAR